MSNARAKSIISNGDTLFVLYRQRPIIYTFQQIRTCASTLDKFMLYDKSMLSSLNVYTMSKNEPNLIGCSFNKHGLILILFGKQHQHTFENDTHIQLFSSFHFYPHYRHQLVGSKNAFYILYLLLNSCDGNEAFWRHSVLMKQSSSFNKKHRIYLSQTVRLTQKPGRLHNLATDAGCVHGTRHLSATPAT